jgi:hypothetical protein
LAIALAWGVALAVSAASGMGGCASASGHAGTRAGAPEDFAYRVIVPPALAAGAATPIDQRVGSTLEPACYTLASDGVLRAAFGRVDPDYRLPPIVRRVPRAERERLYRLLHDAGVLAPNAAGQPVGDAVEAIGPAGTAEDALAGAGERLSGVGTGVVGVWWSADGRRRSFVMLPVSPREDNQGERASSTDGKPRAAEVWAAVEGSLRMLREWSWREGATSSVAGRGAEGSP